MHEPATAQVNGVNNRKAPRRERQSMANTTFHKLSVVIPCYNEATTIGIILEKVMNTLLIDSIEKEIIVVDDCSNDETGTIIEEFIEDNPESPVRYIRHIINLGKGAAVHTAIEAVTGDYVLIQDADLEYDPGEYNLLLEPIIRGHADVVYGSRFMGGNPHRVLFFWHTLGNKLLTFISNLLTNMNLTDAHTCYKLLKTSTLRELSLDEKRFAFDSELNVKIAHIHGLRIYEVGISYYGRTFAEGKKIRLRDALRSIFCLIKYTFFVRSARK